MSLRLGQETEWVWAESASANFFEVLGVTPAYGAFSVRTRHSSGRGQRGGD